MTSTRLAEPLGVPFVRVRYYETGVRQPGGGVIKLYELLKIGRPTLKTGVVAASESSAGGGQQAHTLPISPP